MLTITRAKHTRGSAGLPLPTVFKSLEAETIHIRQGQLTLVAAAPGVGKSVFALTLALRSGAPAFYFSADTDAYTTYVRAAAMFSGWSTEDVEHAIKTGNTRAVDAQLEGKMDVRFNFDARIEASNLENQLQAYALTYGEWPHLIVVDNLMNFDLENGAQGQEGLEQGCDYLHELSRKTGAAVVALHHVAGEHDDGTQPVSLRGIRGKVSKVPAQVLTLHTDDRVRQDGSGMMYVCPVKNRGGKADGGGNWRIALRYEPPRMKLEDYTSERTPAYGYSNPELSVAY